VDCEEQTRPWSAGHCDGHSNGQLDDQPSQRGHGQLVIAVVTSMVSLMTSRLIAAMVSWSL